MSSPSEVVAAIEAGDLVVIPTDTVYGLACAPSEEQSVRALSTLKRRSHEQPIAIVAESLDRLVELIPELAGRCEREARALLPGPFTLVVPNPRRRFPWLAGSRSDTIGIRVPQLTGEASAVLDEIGAVAATSANLHGGPDPRSLEDVPAEISAAVVASLDGGSLPGVPSTVVDLTGDLPSVLREGAVAAEEALARVRAALAQ